MFWGEQHDVLCRWVVEYSEDLWIKWFKKQEAFEKMLGPFATASRRTPNHHMSLLTPPAHRCPRRRQRRQRQRVTEGTAMAQWNGPKYVRVFTNLRQVHSFHTRNCARDGGVLELSVCFPHQSLGVWRSCCSRAVCTAPLSAPSRTTP